MFQQQTSDISQLSSGSIYFPVEGGWKFWLCGRNPTVCVGGRGREEKKKRLKVVAFPTLFTISSDFSTLRNMLFQTQGNLSLHFDLGPLES